MIRARSASLAAPSGLSARPPRMADACSAPCTASSRPTALTPAMLVSTRAVSFGSDETISRSSFDQRDLSGILRKLALQMPRNATLVPLPPPEERPEHFIGRTRQA